MTKPVTQAEMIAKVRAAITDRAIWFALLYRSFKAWDAVGEYTILVKAKDALDLESGWSEPAQISIIALPRLEIGNFTGGFGSISVQIRNVGAGDATNVDWSITLDGKLVFLGKETTGSFLKIAPGFSPKAKSGVVFGFGKTDILVTVGDLQKTGTATLFGPVVLKIVE